MTPHEKAQELIQKYSNYVSGWTSINKPQQNPAAKYEGSGMKYGRAIQCALIAVNELIDCTHSVDTRPPYYQDINESTTEFWVKVKNELQHISTNCKPQ